MGPPGRHKKGGGGGGGGQGPRREFPRPRMLKRKREEEDVDDLNRRVGEFDTTGAAKENFADLPLSAATQDGLKASHFATLTTIQAMAIPLALKGSDILGAAKTGSGKTLAFLVPVLEILYRKRWTAHDGLGALVLSPTRELAIQIFDVLRKVGRHHGFSAGLVIGGKSLREEKDRLGRMNILVATPGRMLQHMDQTAELDLTNLQLLVLDEADRIMDMGFQRTVDAIVEHLPKERQTLLFSATQTRKVSDLARLSLHDPRFVSVHQEAESATPSTLQQNYVVTPLADKLDTLWSFIRANLKKKILVFFSSGKQVRFVYESFRHLQPGLTLLHLHGRQKQTARLDITTNFSNSKYACLLATDVAARGLDFPSVDWVVQVDCPEDADTYIHRVGRTARYQRDGRAVLLVDPSEEQGMLSALTKKKVNVEKINVRAKKMQNSVRHQLQNMCFKDPELKYLGQKAFVSYVRSVHVQKDKEMFDLKKLDLEAFAASLGLPGAPRVKFVKGEDAKGRKNAPRQLLAALEESDGDDGDADADGSNAKDNKTPAVRTKYDRMFGRQNQDVLAEHYTRLIQDDDDDDDDDGAGKPTSKPNVDDDDFLSVKRRFVAGDSALGETKNRHEDDSSGSDVESGSDDHDDLGSSKEKAIKTVMLADRPDAEPLTIDSHRRERLLKSRKKLLKFKGKGAHLTFDSDSDTPRDRKAYHDESTFTAADEERRVFLAEERARAEAMDEVDKEAARRKRQEKKRRQKERERDARAAGGVRPEPTLGGGDDDDDDDDQGVQLVPYEEDDHQETDGRDDDDGRDVQVSDGEPELQRKRPRKWFEDASDDEDGRPPGHRKKQGRHADGDDQPQTLEDLEAMAAGLLAKS